jgi:hypothetical protein
MLAYLGEVEGLFWDEEGDGMGWDGIEGFRYWRKVYGELR